MTQCFDEGTLRAYLAGPASPPEDDRKNIESHLAGCESCRATLEDLRVLGSRVDARMATLSPAHAPDLQLALQKMRRTLNEEHPPTTHAPGRALPSIEKQPMGAQRRNPMQTFSFVRPSRRPALFSGLLAALLIASLVAFPSMRAAADSFLQTFRANSLVFVPVDQSRIQQIEQAAGDPTSLFLTKPEIVGEPTNTRVDSPAAAQSLVNFTPEQPDAFPSAPSSTRHTVHGQMHVQAQVNLENTRKLLQALGVNDVTLPDSLGSVPISADVASTLESEYSGEGYHFTLIQGTTPTVNLPKGVDLAQLGKAGLRLLGMQPEQADKLSKQIDWSTTLVVPFPTGMDNVVQVQVNGADGLMVTAPGEGAANSPDGTSTVIYWQRGQRFYVLSAGGVKVTPDAALIVAKSVK